MGRVDLAAITAQIGVAQIIGEDHQHIRPGGSRESGGLGRSRSRSCWGGSLRLFPGGSREICTIKFAQLAVEPGHSGGLFRLLSQIMEFVGVGVVVVELPPRLASIPQRVAVALGSHADAPQSGIFNFRERRPRRQLHVSYVVGGADVSHEAPAIHACGSRHARQAAHRWQDVDQFHRMFDHSHPAHAGWHRSWRRHDHQRHPRALLKERSLLPQAMLAEVVAMVAGEDDDRVVFELESPEGVEHGADLRIDKRHGRPIGLHRLAAQRPHQPLFLFVAHLECRCGELRIVVGRQLGQFDLLWRVLGKPAAGRHIRRVRPVEADCQKERLLRFGKALEQLHGARGTDAIGLLGIASLRRQPAHCAAKLARLERENQRLIGHIAATGIEHRIPAGGIIEAIGADLGWHAVVIELPHPLHPVASLPECLWQRHHIGSNGAEMPAVVAHLRVARPAAGEEACATRIAQRKLAISFGESHAPGGQRVDIGRTGGGIPIAMQRWAKVIAHHQQNVGPAGRWFGCPCRPTGQEHQEHQHTHREPPPENQRTQTHESLFLARYYLSNSPRRVV